MTSLVLATDIDGVTTSRALAKAGQWLSPALLVSVEVVLVLLWWTSPGIEILWPTIWLAVVGAGVIGALRAERFWVGMLSVVIASGGGAYLYAISVGAQLGPDAASDNLLLSLPKIAAVVAGVGARTLKSCIALCSLGFGLTAATSIVAARRSGMAVAFDVPAFATYIALLVLLFVLWVARGDAGKGASAMNLAGLEEEGLSEEARIISHASSVLHDTVLNDLQALSLAAPGTLSDAQREIVRRDLELLSQNEGLLLAPRSSVIAELRSREAAVNPLASAIARSEARGMRVTVSGDPLVLATLPAPVEQAVIMAVDQCLVNVSRHSGVAEAEVAIAEVGHEITVMVTDAGRGFDASSTDPERLGLRLSVQDRIQAVGGSVRLWSSPGAGTAILLAVPTAPAAAEES
jgi:signal transduction histidine kinase